MRDDITWVVLTDGYYIRIMFYQGQDITLNVYREGDFEKSSDITYKLIIRYRNQEDQSADALKPAEQLDKPGFLLNILGKFLTEKANQNKFEKIIVVGPQVVLDKLNDNLPEDVCNMIIAKIPGDFLSYSQDRLEETLKSLISIKN